MHTISRVEDALPLVDQEIGVSDWVTLDQPRINQFAQATGDHQWIHTDPERAAKELPGGVTIAHGYLTLSLIPALTNDFVEWQNLTRVINYGCNKIRFTNMVPVGSRVRARAQVKAARKRACVLQLINKITIDIEGQERPACVAETISLYFFE